jgi:hypothetical protein
MDATCTDLAAKTGTEDPEGTFTSVRYFAATLLQPEGGECPSSDWAEQGAAGKLPVGLERVSATTFNWPAISRTVGENSAMKDRWRCCLPDQGSVRLLRAPSSGLWSVKMVKDRPSRIKQKCLMAATMANSSLSKAVV